MFMRFVKLKVKQESVEAFERFYEFRLAPYLLEEQGCIFARLIQSDASANEFLSFTLWKSHADAEAYESSGHFDKILEENEPFLEDTTEWKIQLSDDNTLEYKPVKEKPTVQGMPLAAGDDQSDPSHEFGADMYVRIVSARVRTNGFQGLKKMYDDYFIPQLLATTGCHGLYLIGSDESDDVLSITIWESKSYADVYESSGTFSRFVKMASPYLSSLYQWKMSLDSEKQSSTQTSDDLSVEGYHIVTGEKLEESPD